MPTLAKQICPTCHRPVNCREIALYHGLISALWRVFKWCEKNNIHEFQRKEVKHLFLNENDTARFGDLVFYGGLVYKSGKGHYGLNMERCNNFFAGIYEIPTLIIKDPLSEELRKENYCTIKKIPNILTLLNEDREYIVRYREPKYNNIRPEVAAQRLAEINQKPLL